ncbi:uncharacterized protein LOC100845497 isoform X2 [Brachypodium distachyon]|uniref:Uncharacterized protein n=1 Tax=Brachypodium distachyon TaxID=15368 RepID=A0A0Q3HL76_BRADI|nr:uncharacterized protein LOC100845497 isoform X2 [Brachypodium distachyon]KQJ94082.1 hypothetical protein BRADI_3g08382v3 [Brachypodium distachyon]|eukprot:XP_014755756.1 uncharacterized protein LOC100845497 isoform X2 [Brachypodium distachyon]
MTRDEALPPKATDKMKGKQSIVVAQNQNELPPPLAPAAGGGSSPDLYERLCDRLQKLKMKQEHISRLEQRVSSGQDLNKKQALCLKSKDIFDAIVNELERLLNPIDKQGNKSLAVDPGVGDAAESGKQRRENKYNIKKQLVSSEELSNALTFATTITKADDEQTEKMFKEFLTGCKFNVHAKSICTGLVKSMIECGSGTMEIKYSYLEWHNKNLAMKMCRASPTLITRLKSCAKSFAHSVWETDCKASSTEEMERVENMLKQFRLAIEGMPKSHKTLPEFMKLPMLKELDYNGCPLYSPTADANKMVYGILNDVISMHRKGFSWEGEFDAHNIEVYDDTKFTITAPTRHCFDPRDKVSEEVAGWFLQDFTAAWNCFGDQFYNARAAHFGSLKSVLTDTDPAVFCNPEALEVFREVVIHHGAAKPPIARANFLCGVHSCCKAYDLGDEAAPFKTILHNIVYPGDWQMDVRQSNHPVMKQVLSHSDGKINDVPEAGSRYIARDGEEFNSRSSFMRYLATGKHGRTDQSTAGAYVDYMRHLFVHGMDHTKELIEFQQLVCADGMTLYTATNNGSPRVQNIDNLEVLEILGAQSCEGGMTEFIWALLDDDAMTGMGIMNAFEEEVAGASEVA